MSFTVRLKFEGDLPALLPRDDRAQPVVRLRDEPATVREIIQSCGVPHPEVDLIVIDGQPAGFDFLIDADAYLSVLPPHIAPSVFPGHRLQETHVTHFVADLPLGNLVRNLRLLGVDVASPPGPSAAELLGMLEGRALLTRDASLLALPEVRSGYLPRSEVADEQTVEVVRRFRLLPDSIQAYSRCPRCNGVLHTVEEAEEQAKLSTRRYYHDFRRCADCEHLYTSRAPSSRLETLLRRERS